MIFAGDNASAGVAAALNDITNAATAKTIPQILELVLNRLESTDNDGDQQMVDSQEFDDFEEEEEEEEEEYFPGDEDMLPKAHIARNSALDGASTKVTSAFKNRVRNDLLVAKSEGFKVGHLGGLMEGLSCYISLSIRISKLGISEEAMKAWQVEPSEYLVAILYYPSGYKSMDDLRSYDVHQARRIFAIRTGICTTYKPTMQEAITAFAVLSKENERQREDSQQGESQNALPVRSSGFRNSFVSRPLNELFEQRFSSLLKYRYGGMPWQGAELFYNNLILNALGEHHDASHDKYYEDEHVSTTWPKIVTADHITSAVGQEHSLPLVGMQFVLRHFVRCTEFCLICFSKMPDDLQAIKPYVCDNPLCLYQYMSLGFGPSIEHEIISQPKVVDLLVSFCYASARSGRLRDFPTGLSLAVPHPVSNQQGYLQFPQHNRFGMHYDAKPQRSPVSDTPPVAALSMRYNEALLEMLFEDSKLPCPVAHGTWIVIRTDDEPDRVIHCRVTDPSLYPSVKVSKPIISGTIEAPNDYYTSSYAIPPNLAQNPQHNNVSRPKPVQRNLFRSASFYLYNHNFDDLHDHEKQPTIATLLDQLPPVAEMRKYLLRKSQSPLSSWVDRLSPAALGVLRWVIASNRACILQVDEEYDALSGRKAEERLYGMGGWAQFRFAMGAPDKERRFIQAVRQTKERLNLKYPTLFAWHGSPLHNWHSIIREGLHFKETHHGRAYGHGVYHAPDVHTSLGYSNMQLGISWPMSELKIQQALALNEIVNAPQEYVSQTPHLVVAQLDWIQTRYLFVKTRADNTVAATAPTSVTKPLECVEQDPNRTPRGVDGPLIIPIHAIAASRRHKITPHGVSLSS
jgi:ubiquitin-conjugating enzyme E2 Q